MNENRNACVALSSERVRQASLWWRPVFFSAVLLYAATGWPRQYMELAGRVVFAWPMLYFLIPLWISIGRV